MYNSELLDHIVKEYGLQKAIVYCQIESRKSQLMLEDSKRHGEIGSSEWEHERDWWLDKSKELLKIKQNKNEDIRTFRKQPKINKGNKAVVLVKNVRQFGG